MDLCKFSILFKKFMTSNLPNKNLQLKKLLLTMLMFTISIQAYGQEFNIDTKMINKLNLEIKYRERNYEKSLSIELHSFPQTTANYFELITKTPNEFINSINMSKDFEELIASYPNLLIDKDVLVIKNNYVNYNKQKKIEIKSYNIGNGGAHSVTVNYTDSLNQKNIKFFLNSYTDKNITTIKGFYTNTEFKSIRIPKKYRDWVSYNDKLIEPEQSIFISKNNVPFQPSKTEATIIDTLNYYFDKKTDRPNYDINNQNLSNKKIELWTSKKQKFADSLYKNDVKFSNYFNQAILYAEKNLVTNEGLEDLAYFLVSNEKTLNLLRTVQTVGTCSYDDRPTEQMRKIAILSAQIPNWGIFIKSSLNLLNDNISRIAQSNISTNQRLTNVEQLAKLKLNINKILLGSNLRIDDNNKGHYFSDGERVAKSYASLSSKNQQFFKKNIKNIIKDPAMDAFNKLHFYNTYVNYMYVTKDSLPIKDIRRQIKSIIPFLPNEIRSRLENSNKSLLDLLHKEKALLAQFEIKKSTMGSIYSYDYGGQFWKAQLIEKGQPNNIIYDLTMPIGETITPLSNFTIKKDSLKYYIERSKFLQNKLKENSKNELHIEFTDDKSFANYRNNTTDGIPNDLLKKLNFTNAISTYLIDSDYNYTRYFLLKNTDVLAISESKDFRVKNKYKLYNENGQLIY